MLFQTCMSFFLLWNIKEDILKNDGNQWFCWPLTSILWTKNTEMFHKISSFMLYGIKKVIQVWNNMNRRPCVHKSVFSQLKTPNCETLWLLWYWIQAEVMWQTHHELNIASIIFHINICSSSGIPSGTDMNTRRQEILTFPPLLFSRSTSRMCDSWSEWYYSRPSTVIGRLTKKWQWWVLRFTQSWTFFNSQCK